MNTFTCCSPCLRAHVWGYHETVRNTAHTRGIWRKKEGYHKNSKQKKRTQLIQAVFVGGGAQNKKRWAKQHMEHAILSGIFKKKIHGEEKKVKKRHLIHAILGFPLVLIHSGEHVLRTHARTHYHISLYRQVTYTLSQYRTKW